MPVQGYEYVSMENGGPVEQEACEDDVSVVQQPAEKEICRDFKKGNCRRGEKCIYHHPKLEVCRDFQSGRCTRQDCRYMHVGREIEETYSRSGILPAHINNGQVVNNNAMNTMSVGGGLGFNGILGRSNFGMPGISPVPTSGQQICRDFEKGDCKRGSKCRFYHPKLKICRDFQNQKCERDSCRFLHLTREEEAAYEGSGVAPDHIDKEELKKMKVMAPPSVGGAAGMNEMYGKRRRDDAIDPIPGLSNILQENQMLKLKLMELQGQITDLRKMNDTLYEQNSNYRNQSRGGFGGI